MGVRETARIFVHGGSQAVRLPKEYRFEGDEVRIRKEGDKVILEPMRRDWEAFWAEIDGLREAAGEPFPHPPRDDLLPAKPVKLDE
ncbi:MAG: AbrB/MazE/SpoVT family DNA-binding domain-containing protein [Phenylobacterium sp.]|uniref:antitoxin n=1 Tax=Phenylobacterium sp. TaxID=1871053 RepID=UPI001A5595F8|nr:type II toxin-antitoxin system VapB family antitoxin [Phenylobacterium sp.]MBL8770366.1 AbrB/MazE/SpoVT family DNA-binding domain-containing protein [Phenylobacterium sp.]